MTDFTTRNATLADLPAIRQMVQALAAHHGDQADLSANTLQRDAFDWYHILVAETSGTMVGFAALLPLGQLQFGARGMDMHHLFVQAAWRGQGAGHTLIEASLRHSKSLGCQYMMVGTHPENHKAAAFYEGYGFERRTGAGPRFLWRLEK